jgi:hypothetical protein
MGDTTWLGQRSQEIHRRARDVVRYYAQSPDQRALLETLVARLQPAERFRVPLSMVQTLPLLVYAALRGDDEPAVPLAVALTLLWLGIHLVDDLADGDLPADLEYSAPELNLAAFSPFCILPQLVLSALDGTPATIVEMHRALALGLLAGSAGQQRDLALTRQVPMSVLEAEERTTAKSAPLYAIQTKLPALLAGAAPRIVDCYAAFGRTLGTVVAISTDCHDLFIAERSHDLSAAKYTLPIALYLERQGERSRIEFLALLDQARHDEGAQAEVRRHLLATGVLRRCALIVAVHCARARRLLAEARPLEPAGNALQRLVDNVSFVPSTRMPGLIDGR